MRTTSTIISLALLAALLPAQAPITAQERSAPPLEPGSEVPDRQLEQPSRSDSAPATARTANSDTDAAAAARRERFRRLRYGNLAELDLGGRQLRISYPDLLTDSDDYRTFDSLASGDVSAWNSGRAVKLLTHASLSFNGIVVPYGNASPDYPGVYSLWPKRSAEGWSLVFNGEADIWGSQRDPAADALEVPLEHSRADQPTEKLMVELLEIEPGAVLRIAWGDHQFLAAFQAAP